MRRILRAPVDQRVRTKLARGRSLRNSGLSPSMLAARLVRKPEFGGQLSFCTRQKRRQSRTGHGQRAPPRLRGETKPPAYPPSNLRGDEASEPTEAEFPWTWRETEPIGQFVRRTNPGATRQNPHRIPNLVSTRHLSSNRKMIAATCQSSGGESSARNEGCKRSAAPCQVGRQHFFQIVKRRDPKSRRPNCGSRGRTPERAPRKLSAA
jgi:hypothetical protein